MCAKLGIALIHPLAPLPRVRRQGLESGALGGLEHRAAGGAARHGRLVEPVELAGDARPYQPAGKGKIERFFRTLRAAWLAHLGAEATESLDTLNRTLWAWVEGEYHQSPHRGLDGRTPLDQWALAGANVRYPDPTTDLDDLFLFEVKRRVMKDRTVSLHGRVYEADAVLVGQTVTLRYDPDAPPSRPIEVVAHDGKPAGLAIRLDAYANTAVKRDRPSRQLR